MKKFATISILLFLYTIVAQAQITVGGNVYGGGNEGNVHGNATVTVYAGDLNNVFGGARVANVGGRTFVNVDGKNASDDIMIVSVYGGNDISGTIGKGDVETTVPEELENVKTGDSDTVRTHNAIDNSWKTFVRTSACSTKQTVTVGEGENATTVTADDKMMVIGSLYGGGNGDYKYPDPEYGGGKVYHYVYSLPWQEDDTPIATKVTTTDEDGFNIPVLPKTYLEIKGGCIGHVYGGGNNATVTEATTINIENESSDLEKAAMVYAKRKGITDPRVVLADLQKKVKLTTFQSDLTSYAFTHARVFGGNNKATMDIMPKWNLQKGIIRDLYSGGNEGDMTYIHGLLLDIDPVAKYKDALVINNVYGGCRRADVYPHQTADKPSSSDQIQVPDDMVDSDGNQYHFPPGLSARTLVRGGKITNVYGGNDISGRVFGGNAVGIYTSIIGDVYGGGNGSYAYTDNADLGEMDEYKDFYYNIDEVKQKEAAYNPHFSPTQSLSSVEALNIFRPNTEQVSLRLWGESAANPTVIGGSVYVGGNSASLRPKTILSDDDDDSSALVELKIGSHVLADKVFLGNNGEKMVDPSEGGVLSLYAGNITDNGTDYDFSQMNLTDSHQFATYMEGCSMNMCPNVVFDLKVNDTEGDPDTYEDYSTYFGSFYCGGNVGSMKFDGSNTINFDQKVIIFDKLVGGCNNAYVPEHTGLNAAYDGGLIGMPDNEGNKLTLNLSEMKLQPKRWVVERDADYKKVLRNPLNNAVVTDPTKGQVTYLPDPATGAPRYLEWNTWLKGAEVAPVTSGAFTTDDLDRRLVGGNVYGGCCESGHVEGNIVINIDGTIVDREGEYGVFDSATATDGDPDILYDHEKYTITERRSGVILGQQGSDVLGEALTIYGGGKGKGTEVWGKTTVNVNEGYCFQAFGGSESGVIGKHVGTTAADDGTYDATTQTYAFNHRQYTYNPDYSTYVNLNCERPGASRTDDPSEKMADAEYLYGGGFQGPVIGNTYAYIDNGRLFNLFAGACDADILGHAEAYIGQNGFPYLRDHIYGGNDLGGKILGMKDFSENLRDYDGDKAMIHGYDPATGAVPDVLKANAYIEYHQGALKNIFGGHSGNYDYDDEYKSHTIPYMHNSFVNICPSDFSKNHLDKVFGAGEGFPGSRVSDKMQDRSYVLIDIDDGLETFTETEVFGSGSDCGLGMRYPAATTLAVDGQGNPTFDLDEASAIVDLLRGKIANVFGGSYNEGVTRRTVVNVPEESTIWVYTDEPSQDEEEDGTKTKHVKERGNIHGGAYGTQILPPCDVYESNVNYRSDKAVVNGSIFGGNNNERRTLYTHVNIYSPVWSSEQKEVKNYLAEVYGAGKGKDTWAEHTEVNLWPGAQVYEVYGGGMMGHVLNAESVQQYMQLYAKGPSDEISSKDPVWNDSIRWTVNAQGMREAKPKYAADWARDWADAWTLGDYYSPDYVDTDDDDEADSYDYTTYVSNPTTNLSRISPRPELDELDDRTASQFPAKKFNANVIINEGAYVANYAYGGGYGKKKDPLSGDVYGTTYIALLGGQVKKDIYAAGTSGSIHDLFGIGAYDATENPFGFTASSNAYIKGGTCRNVYGGGWEGNVGAHTGDITAPTTNDKPGETNVVIGDQDGTSFFSGIPAVQRNAYGGGEGGAVYGTATVTLNNGYVGYAYDSSKSDNPDTEGFNEQYVEKIEDETYVDKSNVTIPNIRLKRAGCIFGGGYVDNSSVDKTNVYIYGGHVRNSAFGGGEIAAIGRGTITKSTGGGGTTYSLSGIYRPGKTLIEMYGGHVHQNVFGGGRGYDNLNKHGSLNSDGYVFGQTEVHIHGGEIGTKAELSDSIGNVFGGGDVGFVYSAYENRDGTYGRGVKPAGSDRYNDNNPGYYYKHQWYGDTSTGANIDSDGFYTSNVTINGETKKERFFTEDCKVLVEPFCKVNSGLTITNIFYPKNATVSHMDFKYLKDHNLSTEGLDAEGIVTVDEGFTISSRTYSEGEFVPTYALNALGKKSGDSRWEKLDPTGIIIHNAVFAGGNTSTTSTSGAGGINTPSVFGNATASIHDVYHRDLITLGTGHTGGLYGDGNLTLVDGYRELNVTNYGTDYYSIAKEITNTTYHALLERERAYYELRYTCKKDCKDKDSTLYKEATVDENGFTTKASTLTADELHNLFLILDEETGKYSSVKDGNTPIMIWDEDHSEWKPSTTYWIESGVLPVYAGRLMNSLQRADFCGVYGSRMVMQGARDRVPKEPDYTNYTINRVREVSLNKKRSIIAADKESVDSIHGNYFGIYNIVNHLGALTSDVHFGDKRTTDNTNSTYKPDFENQTFFDWKKKHITDNTRNNGNSHNKVALASGVYLELTTEQSTGTDLFHKDWGPITGVIELDLINVSAGIGGGFVYAKNQHGVRTKSGLKNTTLTSLNDNAATHWDYNYSASDNDKDEWETSGNFVHSTQTIIDDCYNVTSRYKGEVNLDGSGAMPAHYWYIKGSVYVYPQLISAHTGLPNAYSEAVEIPLTISAASHGTLKLLDVKPNLYAFYSSPGVELEYGKKMVINDKEYYKNDPISYWDWYLLSKSEKNLFVPETYVNCVACKIDGSDKVYEPGEYIMTAGQFDDFTDAPHTFKDADGNTLRDGNGQVAATDYVFRPSNDISHDTGYILTYDVDNPAIWNNWYTPKAGSYRDKIDTKTYDKKSVAEQNTYDDGPTYRLKSSTGEVLGQRHYKVGELISQDVQTNYPYTDEETRPEGQATFEAAYILTREQTVEEVVNGNTTNRHLNLGVTVPASDLSKLEAGSYDKAYICTSTIKLSETEFIFRNTKMTEAEYNTYYNRYKDGTTDAEKKLAADILSKIVPAYYCTVAGDYGGRRYQSNYNYRGLEAFSSMSQADRDKFDFNYDALDLLIDPTYSNLEGKKYQYDGDYNSEDAVRNTTTGNKAGYSVTQSVDYTASYNSSTALDLGSKTITVQRYNKTTNKIEPTQTTTVQKDDELSREDFEALPNEKRHYAPIVVKESSTIYVVNTPFQIGSTPYTVGNTISGVTYNGLPETEKHYVTELKFTEEDLANERVYYYCREKYKQGTERQVESITAPYEGSAPGGIRNDSILPGTIISSSNYSSLLNDQKDFTIHGISPTETSTLFVSRESDIHNLSQDKIITVIYQYDYEETDASGNITPVSERHVVNIRIQFKSGVPIVEDIDAPDIILPGDFVELTEPNVIFDTNALLDPGWELYETERDAESHSNGIRFDGKSFNPKDNPLYWYQNGWYVAYYISSMESGRSYSNYVPVSVANYHDLKKVMTDKDHHYYIDEPKVLRDPKIYINDYSRDTVGIKNGLDIFKDLFDLSLVRSDDANYTVSTGGKVTAVGTDGNSHLKDHSLLKDQVRAGRNLEFILRSDIDHSGSTWTPIGYDNVFDDPTTTADEGAEGKCFDGVLHGDGHTLSGLDHSLFSHLCGEVYNLGVTGSFTGGGVADEGYGYVESCWTNTTGTANSSAYAVFGNPLDTKGKQIVNCYYQQGKTYNTTTNARGNATPKSDRAFYNGEVAYDLNNFYLYKRYNDNAKPGGTTTYKYWKTGTDEPVTATYASNADLCSTGFIPASPATDYVTPRYVENRFDDGDYIYADGSTEHTIEDARYYPENVTDPETGVKSTVVHHYPIWPDDYLFFGQKLTYGYTSEAHQNVPTAIAKDGGWLSQKSDANRVYRAPAYYRSGTLSVAHFNPDAVFAQTKKGCADTLAYKDMTAIDFTDYQETHESQSAQATYGKGLVAATSSLPQRFYPPLLDDDGLTGFLNVDLTKNLLVYTAATGTGTTAAEKTANVVGSYLTEPAYSESNETYHTVAEQPAADVHGHWVEDGTAVNDHFLVDKHDFNAPISYQFATDKRMWYQRKPANFVQHEWVDHDNDPATPKVRNTKGWEAISLPFSAELVTTQQKGEITHFYSGSEESKNGTHTKSGHEYWLRRLQDESTMTLQTGKTNVLTAIFNYPSTTDGSTLFAKNGDYAVTNTFLWDYYYKGVSGGHNQEDRNSDKYLEYYSEPRYYNPYPLLTNGTAYLLGLPGTTFYEFDLSGGWEARTTNTTKPKKLDPQIITFASVPGCTIRVSDDEMAGSSATYNSKSYTFKPNYLNSPALAENHHAFLLNSNGNSYVEDNASTSANVQAFRPYFTAAAPAPAPAPGDTREITRSIVFSSNETNELNGAHEGHEANETGTLTAHAGKHKIIVTSTLKFTTDVRIVNTAGQTMTTFAIKPGETIETRIHNAGVFIVQDEDGRFIKKLAVE